jgi:tetratricopeptide (TPR) repeat protein
LTSIPTGVNGDSIVFAKINAEEDSAAAKIYSVQGYPTVILLNSDGQEIDRIGGYLPPEEFVETIDNYRNGIGTLDYYLNEADTNPTVEVNYAIAEKFADRGNYEKAAEYYQKVISQDPDNAEGKTPDAMLSLGDIWRWDHEYDAAVDQYKKIMKLYKGTKIEPEAAIRIAVAYRQQADTTKAIGAFETFLKDFPNSPDTSYARSQIDKLKNPPPPEEG